MTKSENYSRNSNTLASKTYLEYTPISFENVTLNDGDKTNLYVFDARYNEQTPVKRFVQLGKVCRNTEYYLVNIVGDKEKVSNYVNLAKSFQCVK